MEPVFKIPPELYATVGGLIATNLGALIAYWKASVKKEVDQALTQQRLDQVLQSLGEIKSKQNELEKDLNAAFRMIKEK